MASQLKPFQGTPVAFPFKCCFLTTVYETSGLIFAYAQPHLSHSQPAKILSVRQYFRFPSASGPLYIWFTDTLLPA